MKHFALLCLLMALLLCSSLGCFDINVPSTEDLPSFIKPNSSTHDDASGNSQKLVVNTFKAEPSTIGAGEGAKLSWSVTGATTVVIDQGIGKVDPSGEAMVYPSSTTTYRLSAENAGNTAVVTTTITVTATSPQPSSGLPVIHLFTAQPDSIQTGESSTLTWNVSDATSVVITPAITGQPDPLPPAGSAPVSPSQTTSYTLTAENAAGVLQANATITVHVPLDWSGTWKTDWGKMELTQKGNHVSGTIAWDEGIIDGIVSGDEFRGTWSKKPSYLPPDDAGDVKLTIAPDYMSISGQWRYGSSGDWYESFSGKRLSP